MCSSYWFYWSVCVFVFPGIPSVCKQVVSVETTRDIEWATNTCTLGFQVFGKPGLPPLPPSLSSAVFLMFIVHPTDVWPLSSAPQACGPTAPTAPTSTASAGATTRTSWLLETTLGRSICSRTPAHSSGWDTRNCPDKHVLPKSLRSSPDVIESWSCI